jgi:hypothetical protein
MRRWAFRGPLFLAGFLTFLLWAAAPVSAQTEPEVKILTVVDYLAGNEVYLAAGTEQGIRVGDTLSVYDGEGEGAELLGLLSIQSATERRSVAAFIGEPFSVQRADLLYLGLPEPLAKARSLEVQRTEEPSVGIPEDDPEGLESAPDPSSQTSPRPPVRLNGRISFDMDALQTTTRWGDSPEEEATRTFSTPTLRFQARAQDLPGGFRLGTSMRLSHRTSPDNSIQPRTSTRFYQLDLEKRFEAIPLQLHLGRFHNPFDDYSGYWDGLMVHYGDRGLGGGFAVGFEPDLWDETVSSDLPKASGFIDYNVQGETAGYSGAISVTALRPKNGLPDQSTVGFSQRLSLGNAWLRQRASVDKSLDTGAWVFSRFQLDASIPLSQGLSVFGGWRRWRSPYAVYPATIDAPRHDRANAGLSYWAMAGGVTATFSLDRPEVGEKARTVSGSFYLRRTPLLGLGFSGTASYWKREESTSFLISPEVRRDFGKVGIRLAYRLLENSLAIQKIRSQFADLTLTLPIARGLSARLQGFIQWGDNYSSNRILASFWKSF